MFRVGVIALLIFAGYELGRHRAQVEYPQPLPPDSSFRLGPFLRCKQQYESEQYPVQQVSDDIFVLTR